MNAATSTNKPRLRSRPPRLSPVVVQRYLETLQRVGGYLHHTVNTRLALDILLLQLPAYDGA